MFLLFFVPPEAWPEYGHESDPAPICKREKLQGGALRWSLWPLCFEEYIGDTEPDIAASSNGELAYNRFVIWRRVARTKGALGWFAPSKKAPEVDGFKLLEGDVTDGWNKNARRDLTLWQKNYEGKTHTIEQISLAEYATAYAQRTIAKP